MEQVHDYGLATRWRKPIALLCGVALATLSLTLSAQAQTPETPGDSGARQATVFLMQVYESSGAQVLSCVGSGTLISGDGLILTNAHLAEPLGPCRGERVIVALPVRLDEPPVPTYLAETVQVDDQLDLAVLQITSGLDGSLIDTATLNLPFTTLGDPSTLLPGSGLTFVGYPDIGATSVEAVQGVVTGITSEKSGSRMAWLRTDSELGGGMSGGGAYDGEGRLVGILTSAPATTGNEAGPMCLNIQDNTRDGLITERDACVPIGGDVTTIRPIVFARPLVEAARNGFRLEHMPGMLETPPTGEPSASRLFFSPQISDAGLPTQIVSGLPSGVTNLYFFFDYANMLPGTPYEILVTRDGIEMPQFSLGPLAWGGGRSGMWYMGTEGKTWPDGSYEFIVLLSGQAVASARVSIGGLTDPQTFSNLSFGMPDGVGGLATTGTLLPAGITEFAAQFDFEGMQEGQAWTEVWLLDRAEVYRETRLWDRGSSGQTTVSAINMEGLPLGTYRLELYIGERLAATGDVTLAGAADPLGNPSLFANNRLASEITRDGAPAGQTGASGLVLPLGVTSLYSFVNWDYMPSNVTWSYRWFLDGRLVATRTLPWNAGGVGRDFWVGLVSNSPLPEGAYAVEVLVQNRPMYSASLSIGSGTQPISGIEAEADEVLITGTVRDALTGEGIPGALILILDVAFESPDFTWNESQVHTQAISDRQGRFELPRGLARRNFYTAYVFAEGYITIVEDSFTILRDQPSPTDIFIEMSRP